VVENRKWNRSIVRSDESQLHYKTGLLDAHPEIPPLLQGWFQVLLGLSHSYRYGPALRLVVHGATGSPNVRSGAVKAGHQERAPLGHPIHIALPNELIILITIANGHVPSKMKA
jgi:hypothetical protein